MKMSHCKRVANATTKLPPCAIQYVEGWILVGTYKLDEEKRERFGSLDVYNTDLALADSQPTDSAILDVKVSKHDSTRVWSAQSTGSIIQWRREGGSITKVNEFQLFDQETLVLAIAESSNDPTIMSATLTTGEVVLIRIDQDGLSVESTVQTHSLEAWISEFGSLGPLSNVLFSGGDDSIVAAHDIRTMDSGHIWARRLHDAGVTSILPASKSWMHDQPETLWTGGYDDKLRSIDLRMAGASELSSYMIPRVKDTIDLGGGVWRLLPNGRDNRVLACCMYGGARIVNPSPSSDEGEFCMVENTITEGHDSMVYGGAWIGDNELVTCSFYDRVVQTWTSS